MASRTRRVARKYEQIEAEMCPETQPVQADEQISEKIHELKSGNIEAATRAAEFLYRRAHASHLRSEENKRQIRSEGAIPHLCELLTARSRNARYQGCSCLSELAFGDERNSLLIVSVPGALDGIIQLMVASDVQEDAALVISNCAAFSEEAVGTIVQHPGLVAALKVVATSVEPDAKACAVGAINCLSRFAFATEMLLAENVVSEALMPVLRESGDDEEFDSLAMRAALAVANLTGLTRESFVSMGQYNQAVSTAVQILEGALAGKAWQGIWFSPYSVLYPLRNLAMQPEHQEVLVAAGLLELVVRVLQGWQNVANKAPETLALGVEVAHMLRGRCDWQQRLRDAGAMPLLANVHGQRFGEDDATARRAGELLQTLEEGHVAVSMAQHQRLGADSPLALLDDHVTSLILAYTVGGCAGAPKK